MMLGHGSFSRSPVNREGALTLRSTPSLPHMPSHADTAGQLHVALPPFGPAPPPHARDKLHEEYSARVALHCRVSTTPETSCHGRRDHYTANLSLPHLGDDDGQPVCKRAHVTADEPASKSSGGGFQAQTTHSTLLVHSHKLPCMPVTWELDPQQLHPAQREDWLKDRAQAPTTAVSPSHRATSTARSTSKPQTGKTPAAREAASTRERCRRGAISTQIDTMRALVFEPSGKRHSELTVLICALYTLYKRDSHFRMSPEQSYHGALLTQQDVTDAAMLEIVNSERQRKKLPPVASLGHFTYPRSASPSAPERVEEEPCTTASRKMVARVARGGATMPVDAPLLDASSCEEQQSVQDTQQAAASQSSTRNSRKNNQERKSRSLKAQVICKMASLLPSATTREKQLEATCERLRFLQRPEKRQGKLDPSEMSNFLRLLCDRDTTPYKQHN
ncbi:hypothetical protein PTSG_09766 [Salpingoeca rosetta]|uniref:BHLH domain-containing protein n=1 Tax=Salpingoeca rosetta (strain ATCC 50818 / BSB-021) TaxID=946362 RepID=F2UNZ7_SALR5|nr:uncharacterized protein PTSG_09766 [Salpingoeca rosetta]EGD79352.1 hypothetical protein PTSG_09766 [Salpingoeca rosetta]|eukprot:XP_004989121.1 hypothetical protein PTSG_09766 [Salpingoeca rosetta]